MIKKDLYLAFALMFTSILGFSQADYNLDLEDFDPSTQKLPTGWFIWGKYEGVTTELDSDGNRIAKITSDKKGKFGCIVRSIPANIIGDSITLKGRIKFENVKSYVGLIMRIDGIPGRSHLGFDNMSRRQIQGTRDWQEYSITLPLPKQARTIYVGGILGTEGTAWYNDFEVLVDGKNIETIKETPKTELSKLDDQAFLNSIAETSKSINVDSDEKLSSSLDALIETLSDKKIVALGESTHGTAEYYKLRSLITKRLVEEKGFNMVILENPYDALERLADQLNKQDLDSLMRKNLFPIYQTEEIKSFLEWYAANSKKYDLDLKGCDDSFYVSYELLKKQLSGVSDTETQKLLKKIKKQLNKEGSNFRKQIKLNSSNYDLIQELENHLRAINVSTPQLSDLLFNIKNTYHNYKLLQDRKPIKSRDEVMADRISYFAKNRDAKIIVWAHDAHISNYVIAAGEIGIMGRDLKNEYGNNYHAIGFSTLEGSYSYMDEKLINTSPNYTQILKQNSIKNSEELLWEEVLAKNGNAFYTDMSALNKQLKKEIILGDTKLIGYNLEDEKSIYYVPFLDLYDTLIFLKETSATTPLFNNSK